MATKTLQGRISPLKGTTTNLNNSTVVPVNGELVLDTTTRRIKIGDGTNTIKDLKYMYPAEDDYVMIKGLTTTSNIVTNVVNTGRLTVEESALFSRSVLIGWDDDYSIDKDYLITPDLYFDTKVFDVYNNTENSPVTFSDADKKYFSKNVLEILVDLYRYKATGAVEVATKLGTTTVGSGTKLIYLNDGSPVASSSTVGSTSKPVYMNAGTITEISATVGGTAKPVYLNAGTITAFSSTIGSTTKPVYMNAGSITASNATVGSGIKPIYMNAGTITVSSSTVGASTTPVYMNAGTITAVSGINASLVNTGTLPLSVIPQGALERMVVVATDADRLKLTTSQVQLGDTVKVTSTGLLYYVIDESKLTSEDGYEIYTAGRATVAATAESVAYSNVTGTPTSLKNPTALSLTVGTAAAVSYDGSTARTVSITLSTLGAAAASHTHTVDNITGTLPITKGGTGATTAATVLTNLGITATATELNYVDGVTSNIQTQLNAKSGTSHNHDTAYLKLSGGTLTGAINMGAKNITNAATIAATTFTGSLNVNYLTQTSGDTLIIDGGEITA